MFLLIRVIYFILKVGVLDNIIKMKLFLGKRWEGDSIF